MQIRKVEQCRAQAYSWGIECNLMNKSNSDSKCLNRLEAVQALVDDVHSTLAKATAHGRILVGPPDENGIGDDTFPAWARRNHELDENDSIDNCISTLGKDEAGHVESEGSVTEEDTVSEESSISIAPPPLDRYKELEYECKKLLDHNSKIIEAENALYPPPKIVTQNTDGDEEEEEFLNRYCRLLAETICWWPLLKTPISLYHFITLNVVYQKGGEVDP